MSTLTTSNESIEQARRSQFCSAGRNCYENCTGWGCTCACHCSSEGGAVMLVSDHERDVLFQIKIARDQALCDAIKEVEKLRPMNGQFEHNRNVEPWKIVFDLYYQILARLKSLGTQREESADVAVTESCPHCNRIDCECSDFDGSPDMGAKG